jgi:hypothetical protein
MHSTPECYIILRSARVQTSTPTPRGRDVREPWIVAHFWLYQMYTWHLRHLALGGVWQCSLPIESGRIDSIVPEDGTKKNNKSVEFLSVAIGLEALIKCFRNWTRTRSLSIVCYFFNRFKNVFRDARRSRVVNMMNGGPRKRGMTCDLFLKMIRYYGSFIETLKLLSRSWSHFNTSKHTARFVVLIRRAYITILDYLFYFIKT